MVHCHILPHEDQGMMVQINFTGSTGARYAPAYGNQTCRATETCTPPLIDPTCYTSSAGVKRPVLNGMRVGKCPPPSPSLPPAPPPSPLGETCAAADVQISACIAGTTGDSGGDLGSFPTKKAKFCSGSGAAALCPVSCDLCTESPCEKLQECTDECASDHVVCKSGCADKKKCKKKCKKDKKKCKNSCESTYKCDTSCEDNTIPGFGSWWCELNAPEPSFCSNEAQKNKCKKTCGLCG